ncbi:hypothetical protein CBM2586_B50018 [Cupriavidus phytorum]|uniref:Uncharacterized protein n=1 Tax=Cupriavidus taiwanensis TaxID=164546 RepID=A0A976AB79_9BURK|nr:hypothetical protein CBM2586_B50018 [Cupriavidus taiwanensis]
MSLIGNLAPTIGVSPPNTGYKTYNIVWHDCGTASASDQARCRQQPYRRHYRTPERNR